MKKSSKSRNTHVGKSKPELQNYARFIQGTRGGSRQEDTGIPVEESSLDESSDAALQRKNDTAGLNPKKQKSKKRPRKSNLTYIRENIWRAAGAIILVIFAVAIQTLWSLNREVGEINKDVESLQDKYNSASLMSSGTDYDVFKAQVQKDLEYIKDRLQTLELKIF